MENKTCQTLVLEEQTRLAITGVKKVDGFTDEKISISLQSGTLTIVGQGLKIRNFSESTGAFCCDGQVLSLRFGGAKHSLVKRIFK